MGLSSSQVRLCSLTSRKNDIGLNLQHLSLQKMSLAREQQKVSRKYQEALNAKTYKFSNNQGATYNDLTYNNLMNPGAMNLNQPYLITDQNGAVVVDTKYKDYAEMIKNNGGKYNEPLKTQMLAQITGISEEKIKGDPDAEAELGEIKAQINELGSAPEYKVDASEILAEMTSTPGDKYVNKNTEEQTVGSGTPITDDTSWGDIYESIQNGKNYVAYLQWNEVHKLFDSNNQYQDGSEELNEILNSLAKSIQGAFADYPEVLANIDSAKTKTYQQFNGYKDYADKHANGNPQAGEHAVDYNKMCRYENEGSLVERGKSTIALSLTNLMKVFLTNLFGDESKIAAIGDSAKSTPSLGEHIVENSEAKNIYDAWIEERNALLNELNEKAANLPEGLTAEEKNKLQFYDAIFSAIAAHGATYNPDVTDSQYLNQMLQNNVYTITTPILNTDIDVETEETFTYYSYETNYADNCNNIYKVSDTDVRNDAYVEYEHQKSIINNKETSIDIRMKNLETEQEAINKMIQSIEKIKDDNTQRFMSVFNA